MSRVGKKPIEAPQGVSFTVKGQDVAVRGPTGELSFRVPDDIAVALDGGALTVNPRHENARARALWGMSRAILASHTKGVAEGFERTLELTGVGYRASMQGAKLQLQLGFSHDVVYEPPTGVKIETPKQTEIKISGIDKQLIGQVAADIRKYRPPEPYKGKGIKFTGERIRRKEGKKK
jgi:large subunit ribosomal protein L6